MSDLNTSFQEPEFLSELFGRVNSTLNEELLVFDRLRQTSELLLDGKSQSNGFIEASMQYLTEGLTSWAEKGLLLGPYYQSIAVLDFNKQNEAVPVGQIHQRFSVLEEGTNTAIPLERLRRIDVTLMQMALCPMMFVHNIRCGAAYLGATEQALRRGKDGVTAHRCGLRSVTAFAEDLDQAQQQLNAVTSVASSIFRDSIEGNQELPRSRLSSFMFTNWPNNRSRKICNCLAQLYAESAKNGVVRYTALLGFHVNLPIWLGLTGFDIRRFVIATDFIHFGDLPPVVRPLLE